MYFDPGIGSLIVQAIIAVIAVGGGYLAIAKTRLKNLFSGNKGGGQAAEDAGGRGSDADDTL